MKWPVATIETQPHTPPQPNEDNTNNNNNRHTDPNKPKPPQEHLTSTTKTELYWDESLSKSKVGKLEDTVQHLET